MQEDVFNQIINKYILSNVKVLSKKDIKSIDEYTSCFGVDAKYFFEESDNVLSALNMIDSCINNSVVFLGKPYSKEQMDFIRSLSIESIKHASCFDPSYSLEKMRVLLALSVATKDEKTIKKIRYYDYDKILCIFSIYVEGGNYKKYVGKEYTCELLAEIVNCLREKVSVKGYDSPDTPPIKLELLRNMKKNGVIKYERFLNMRESEMTVINTAIKAGANLNEFDLSYDDQQLTTVITFKTRGYDDEFLYDKRFPAEELVNRCDWLKENENEDAISDYVDYIHATLDGYETIEEIEQRIMNVCENASDACKHWFLDYFEILLVREYSHSDYNLAKHMQRVFKLGSKLGISAHMLKFNICEDDHYTKEMLDAIEYGFFKGLPIKSFTSSDLTEEQIYFIIKYLDKDIDLSCYVKSNYVGEHLHILELAYYDGADLEVLAKPDITAKHMQLLYEDLISGLDIEAYAKPDMPFEEVKRLSNLNREKQIQAIKRMNLL